MVIHDILPTRLLLMPDESAAHRRSSVRLTKEWRDGEDFDDYEDRMWREKPERDRQEERRERREEWLALTGMLLIPFCMLAAGAAAVLFAPGVGQVHRTVVTICFGIC